MRKTFILFLGLLPVFAFGQGLYNNGAKIVVETGATVYIDGGSNGNYVNANGGEIDIDGTIVVEGDFTNNAANNVFINTGSDGEVVFAGGTQTITSPIAHYVDFEKVTINSGSSTSLVAASGMTTNGTLDINGTFTLETPSDETVGGSLITATGAAGVTGTGTLNINRFFKTNGRWQYVSVPMTGQQSDIFTTGSSFNPNFYTYNEAFNQTESTDPSNIAYSNYDYGSGYNFWEAWDQVQSDEATTVTMNPAIGYITYNDLNVNANFTTSTPSDINNDGSYSPAVSYTLNDCGNIATDFYDGWNLIGNPYQSALNWNDANWTKTNITGTVYMWDGDAGNYIYYENDASHLQGTGQTLNSDANGQYIPAMQSFMVKATAASPTLTIPNQARVHNDNQMYKGENNVPEFDYIKLQVETNGQSDQTIVRFFEEATESVDDEFDAYKMYATTPGLPQIYSIVNQGTEIPVAINSLPIDEYVDYKQVPLGIVVKQNGEYVFTAAELNTNYFDKIYLIDKGDPENIVYTDLLLTPNYSVYLEAGELRDRFSLLGVTSTTDIDDVEGNSTDVNIYSYEQTVYISIPDIEETNGNVEIYDALGRNIYTNVANSTYNEYQLNVAPGTYIVKYFTQNNTYIRKISIN